MRKYKVSIQGYGCEATIGSASEELKEILSNPDKELIEIVTEDLDDYGGWYEIDDQFHRWGASGHYTIEISDEEGNTVLSLNSDSLHDHDDEEEGFSIVQYEDCEVDDSQDLLMCVGFEKGSFFEGDIETEEEFDIKKLRIRIDEAVGIPGYFYGDILGGVFYDDEEIDNYGGSTDGKSFEAHATFRD